MYDVRRREAGPHQQPAHQQPAHRQAARPPAARPPAAGRLAVRRLALALLTTALAFLLQAATSTPASAHAALRTTDPAEGEVLNRAPRQITLTFSEPVALRDDSFRVLDPEGHRVRTGEATRADARAETARVPLAGTLTEGTYTVAWRVVSADSHPISGAFTFSVGRPSATSATAPRSDDPVTTTLHTISRYLAYLSAALLIGTAAFAAMCRPPDPAPLGRLLRPAWWTLLATTVALLVLRAPYEAGTSPSTALEVTALTDTLATRPGQLLALRLALLIPTAVLLRTGAGRTRAALPLGAALAVALALTWPAAEHAAAGPQVPLAITSSVLHLLATATWLGGLAALLTTLQNPEAVIRFSRVALTSVTVLVVTGVYQSWRGLGSWQALTETPYGRLLLAKILLVALLLGAAAFSRRWTRPTPAPRALRRSVLTEAAIATAVLAVTTVLTGTAPSRATEAAPTPGVLPASVTTIPFEAGPSLRGTVQITLDPGRTGDNSVQAVVYAPDGTLATVPELRLTFTLPTHAIGPLNAHLTDRGGYWSTNTLTLPLPGTWTMKTTIRVSETDQVSETRRVRIRP